MRQRILNALLLAGLGAIAACGSGGGCGGENYDDVGGSDSSSPTNCGLGTHLEGSTCVPNSNSSSNSTSANTATGAGGGTGGTSTPANPPATSR